MTDEPELSGDDRLAAELALCLLDGAELAEAERRHREDPIFAAAVADWEMRLIPLAEGIRPETPDPGLWERIAARLGDAPAESATIHILRRKANLWRAYSAAVTAIAAALALVIGLESARQDPVIQVPAPAPAVPAPTLVASLAAEGGPAAIVISYDPDAQSLIATPAVLNPAAGHDHELWVIPGAGPPRSLGLVAAGKPQRITLPPALLKALGPEATLAVSVEPEGGSPTGQPTGPVIASGQLTRI